jgi:hypothetical protein
LWGQQLLMLRVITIEPLPIPFNIPPNIEKERPHSTHVDSQWKWWVI